MKRYLSLIISLLLIFSVFPFALTSCSQSMKQEAVDYVLDAALELLEEKSSENTIESSSGTQTETESQTESDSETESQTETESETFPELGSETLLEESGTYDDKENVALYIHIYGKLPPNYITKAEAQNLGWEGGSVEQYAPGKCIGGSYFGNYEGNLPAKDGREYHECDIDTLGESSRGAKRIVYSNDGLIYYTDDHYETFELLYGEE